jgi:hypothetical protein
VIFFSPVIADASGLLDHSKQPTVQAAVAEDTIQGFVRPVLPQTSRINEVGVDMMRMQLRRDLRRHTLRAMVTLHILRGATWGQQLLEHLDNRVPGDRANPVTGQAIAGLHTQHL